MLIEKETGLYCFDKLNIAKFCFYQVWKFVELVAEFLEMAKRICVSHMQTNFVDVEMKNEIG